MRRMTGPIFKVTVPAMIIRSLCRGLGRNTPAPKRSISKRPAPVAIISIAQHAKPNVIGHSADLRAQLTTGAARSTAFAPTLRRSEFMIESTVVRTKPSSCSAMIFRDEGGGMRDDSLLPVHRHLLFHALNHTNKHRYQFLRFLFERL